MVACIGPRGEPLAPNYSGLDKTVDVREFPAWSPLDRDFDEIAQVTLAGSAGGVTFTPIVSYVVPDGVEAVARWWGQDVAVSTAFQDVKWRIRVSGEVRLVYPELVQVCTIIAGGLCPISIFARGGQTIFVEGSTTTATARVVRARLKGLYRPGQAARE